MQDNEPTLTEQFVNEINKVYDQYLYAIDGCKIGMEYDEKEYTLRTLYRIYAGIECIKDVILTRDQYYYLYDYINTTIVKVLSYEPTS